MGRAGEGGGSCPVACPRDVFGRLVHRLLEITGPSLNRDEGMRTRAVVDEPDELRRHGRGIRRHGEFHRERQARIGRNLTRGAVELVVVSRGDLPQTLLVGGARA